MKKKILIVEDDKQISLALGVRLRASGYDVIQAFDGLAAVSQAKKHLPDLIVLDISVPAGGGFVVAERLQDMMETASTPLLFITASRQTDLRERAMRLGAVGFLEKPIDSDALLALIQKATGDGSP